MWWGEIFGRTMVVSWLPDGTLDREQSGAWWDLDQLLAGTFEHESGAKLRLRAASVDSSDGTTMDAVYGYVRRRLARGFMAIKGESHDPKKDIFTPPKLSVDLKASQRPHPSGVRPFIVGTQVGKDLILGVEETGGRIKLLGAGPGRMHWYATVRPDYWDRVTAEVKVPHRTMRGRLVWQCLSGRRNEALDCEVYALHAARSLKLNLFREERWNNEEAAMRQPTLGFEDTTPKAVIPAAARRAEDINPASEGERETPVVEVQTPAPPPPAPVATPAPRTVTTRPVGAHSKPGFFPSKGFGAKSW